MDQRSGDDWFIGRVEILAIYFWKEFSTFRDAGREDFFCSEQDHPDFTLQEEGQSRGTESPEGGLVSTRETTHLHDLRPLSSDWRSWYSIRLRWFILCYSSRGQHSGIRYKMGWDFIIFWPRFHPPSDDVLESLYKMRTREFDQLKTVLELYDMEMNQKISMSDYQKLKTKVKRSTDQKLRWRNFDARHGRIQTAAVVRDRKGMSGVEGGKGICYQWKEQGQCSKGDQYSFRHESNDRAQKPEHKAAAPSEPSMSGVRSVSRKRSIRSKVTMGSFFDNRADDIWRVLARDRLVNIGILSSVNLTAQKQGVKSGISVCSRNIRLMNNQTTSQRKANIPTQEEKATRRTLWLMWNVYRNSFASRKSRSLWNLKEAPSLWETRCKKSWDRVDQYDSYSLRFVKQVSEKRKDHRLKKYKSKFLISEVPTLWNMRTDLRKRLKDNSDVPEGRLWNLAKNKHKVKEKEKAAFYSPAEEWVLPAASTKEQEERVCGCLRSEYAYGQWERNSLCWVGDHEDIKKSDDGDDGQWRGANKRRSDSTCQTLGLICQSDASWGNSRSSFAREALQRTWEKLPLDQWSETIKNGRKIDCNSANCVPSSPPTSSSQDTVITTEYPATERSEWKWQRITQWPFVQGVPEWLEEFKDSLADESVPEHRDASGSFHELPLKPRANVVSGKRTAFLPLPEGPKFRHLLENRDYKGFLQQTDWYSRAQSGNFWWFYDLRITKF